MTANGWLQIAIFFALILVCAKPLGSFIATVIEGRKNFLTPVLGPVERLIYRICGVRGNDEEQHWTRYAGALLAFSLFSALLLYVMQRLQGWLPFNPQGFSRTTSAPTSASTQPTASSRTPTGRATRPKPLSATSSRWPG